MPLCYNTCSLLCAYTFDLCLPIHAQSPFSLFLSSVELCAGVRALCQLKSDRGTGTCAGRWWRSSSTSRPPTTATSSPPSRVPFSFISFYLYMTIYPLPGRKTFLTVASVDRHTRRVRGTLVRSEASHARADPHLRRRRIHRTYIAPFVCLFLLLHLFFHLCFSLSLSLVVSSLSLYLHLSSCLGLHLSPAAQATRSSTRSSCCDGTSLSSSSTSVPCRVTRRPSWRPLGTPTCFHICQTAWTQSLKTSRANSAFSEHDLFLRFVNLLLNDSNFLLEDVLSKIVEIAQIEREIADRQTWLSRPEVLRFASHRSVCSFFLIVSLSLCCSLSSLTAPVLVRVIAPLGLYSSQLR
jgi:hypothetical protein